MTKDLTLGDLPPELQDIRAAFAADDAKVEQGLMSAKTAVDHARKRTVQDFQGCEWWFDPSSGEFMSKASKTSPVEARDPSDFVAARKDLYDTEEEARILAERQAERDQYRKENPIIPRSKEEFSKMPARKKTILVSSVVAVIVVILFAAYLFANSGHEGPDAEVQSVPASQLDSKQVSKVVASLASAQEGPLLDSVPSASAEDIRWWITQMQAYNSEDLFLADSRTMEGANSEVAGVIVVDSKGTVYAFAYLDWQDTDHGLTVRAFPQFQGATGQATPPAPGSGPGVATADSDGVNTTQE